MVRCGGTYLWSRVGAESRTIWELVDAGYVGRVVRFRSPIKGTHGQDVMMGHLRAMVGGPGFGSF